MNSKQQGTRAEADALLVLADLCGGGRWVEPLREGDGWIVVAAYAPGDRAPRLIRVGADGSIRREPNGQETA